MDLGIPISERLKSSLGSAGVAGFFADDVVTLALVRASVFERRGWAGWCNMPGSYDLSKRLRILSNSKFSDTILTGANVDPSIIFQQDVANGPMYRAAHSGTVLTRTGHVARLLEEECAELVPVDVSNGRRTTPVGVTIVELHHAPKAITHPKLHHRASNFLAILPVAISGAASVACALEEDWVSFAMIALGMVTSGLASTALGSAMLTFDHPIAASGAPSGDGFLMGNREVVIVKGEEDAVNTITRGRFSLSFKSHGAYNMVGVSSVLFGIQFLAQLLLVPQGTLYGQTMFLGSLAASWLYSSRVAALDNGKIQRKVLIDTILEKPRMRKYVLGTRTSMAVFTLLVLKPDNVERQLDELLPNDTKVWKIWKENVVRRLKSGEKLQSLASDDVKVHEDLSADELSLLQTLYKDVAAAEQTYEHSERSRNHDV